jgi:tripartite-type tricarboxylate transporter receptor subunit TctC
MSVGVLWLGTALFAAAQDGEFWRGKTITIVVPTGPHSGYDAYARLVSRHIGKHIPGRPSVAVQNMPGAGGMTAANFIAGAAPKDGTVFAMLERAVAAAPLLHAENSKASFDPLRLNWLGSLTHDTAMGVLSTRAPAQSLEEARKTELVFGAAGAESDAAIYARLLNALLGTRIKVISTFKTQPEIFLAMERGELHGLFVPAYSGNARSYVEDQVAKGQMKLLIQMTLQKEHKLPDVPGVLDYVSKDNDRQLVELLLARLWFGRPLVAPPDLPPERIADLRNAFNNMMRDPELLADAKQSRLPMRPMLADDAEDFVRRLYQSPHNIVQRARRMVAAP